MSEYIVLVIFTLIGIYFGRYSNKFAPISLELKVHTFLREESERLKESNEGGFVNGEKVPGDEMFHTLLNDSYKLGYEGAMLDLRVSLFKFFKDMRR